MKKKMKYTIIETITVTVLDPVYEVSYFVDGKKVNEKTYKSMNSKISKNFMLDKTVIRERTDDWGNKKKTTNLYYIEK